MKHLKAYESLNQEEPKLGDFVICNEESSEPIRINFLRHNIGVIVDDNFAASKVYKYLVQYENIPDLLVEWFADGDEYYLKNSRRMSIDEIVNFSSNRADLEIFIDQNKFNL